MPRFTAYVLGLLVLATSCTTASGPLSEGAAFDSAAAVAPAELALLTPGETIEVKFLYTPELNEKQVIRPDASISMPLIGQVQTRGLDVEGLRRRLLERYKGKLIDPQISVFLREGKQVRRVFVGGAVLQPKAVQVAGPITALEAVMLAGGPNMEQAAVDSVIVIRQQGKGRRGYRVDLSRSLRGEAAEPFHLRQNDVVYVPQTTIVKVDTWIDQHLTKILPSIGFTYLKSLDNGFISVDRPR